MESTHILSLDRSVFVKDAEQVKQRFSLKEAFLNWIGLFLVLVAVVILYFVIRNMSYFLKIIAGFIKILMPVIYGAVIAYLVNPLCKRFYRLLCRTGKDKELSDRTKKIFYSFSIVLGLVSGILIIVILGWMVFPEVYKSILSMVDNLPEQVNHYYTELTKWLTDNPYLAGHMQKMLLQVTDYFDAKMNSELYPWLQKELLPNVNTFAGYFASGVMSFVSVLYNLFIGLIVAIYLLGSKREFLGQAKKILYSMFRKDQADVISHYTQLANQMFSGFIVGKIVDSTIIGVICFLFMSIFQFPYALLVSLIVGVTNVIPVFGPYIGAVPSVLLILIVNPVQAIYFAIWIIVLQQLDGNVIGPAILGESTGLSAFWVLFAILLFGGLWGILGMLVGVPLFALIYQIISDIVNARLERRKMSTITDHYIDLKEIVAQEDGMVYVKYTEDELSSKAKKQESDFMKNLRRIWNEKSVSVLKKQKGDSDKTSTGKVLDDKKTVDKTAANASKDENDS